MMAMVGPTRVAIEWGAPQKRGREIWGELVKWGEEWSPGSDEAATITTDDFIAGGAWLPSLDVGQCESLAVPADAYVPVDTYTLGAIVDAYGGVPELLEGNNATAGGELLVTF